MAMACEHLLEGGAREFLYVTEPQNEVSTRHERAAAFGDCMAAHAGTVRGEVAESEEGANEALDQALRALVQRALPGRRPAVIAGNAVVTLRVAAAVARLGWRFGDALGFVGFDDTEWAPLVGPGLSTIAQPTDAIGRAAATCLIERLNGLESEARQLLLPGELVVRGSSLG